MFQSLAILEVVHALIGLVKSPVVTTAIQVASRLFLVWGVTDIAPAWAQAHWLVSTMVVSWALTEVPRYAFYAWNVASPSSLPGILKWLRYSTFLPLYPSGAGSEWGMVWLVLEHVRQNRIFSLDLPNAYNAVFNYHLVLCVVIPLYLPGLPFMYKHMMIQRAKALAPHPDHAAAKKKN